MLKTSNRPEKRLMRRSTQRGFGGSCDIGRSISSDTSVESRETSWRIWLWHTTVLLFVEEKNKRQ